MSRKKILLLDSHNLMNRAFYAVPALTNSQGAYTNAVHGFLNIFFRFLDEEKPDYLAAAFDLPEPTFRDKMFAEYKGTRHETPPEMREQFPVIKNLLKLMGVKIIEAAGYEADDVLGTFAKKAVERGLSAVIVSGDRDMLQCAADDIKIRVPKTVAGKTVVLDYDKETVIRELGVTPEQFISVKALMGDTSDNIPGVSGIGEKTAFKIIQQYGDVETAIANAENIKPPRAGANLRLEAETARLSYALAKIDTDAPVEFKEEELKLGNLYTPEAKNVLERLEMRVFAKRFEQYSSVGSSGETVILGEKEAEDFVKGLLNKQSASFKINFPAKGDLFPSVTFFGDDENIEIKNSRAVEICKTFFESRVEKTTADAKDAEVYLRTKGIALNNVVFDTALAAYLLETDENREDELKKGLARSGLDKLYYEVEAPVSKILAEMEIAGVKVDRGVLSVFGAELDKQIAVKQENIYALSGEAFNINSPKQLGVILFEKLALKGGKKTKGKTSLSTSAEVLENLIDQHPIISEILEYRTYTKLKSTYVDGLSAVIGADGRIHAKFNQTQTVTGRLSSSDPNLQNIPVRTELGRNLRAAFVPEEGSVFIDADYSQIELRLLAHLSGDKTFIDAFNNNADIHKLTASEAYNVPLDEVTPERRRAAKAVNFGIIYGMSAYRLSNEIGVSVREAEKFISDYFARYPAVKNYLDKAVDDAKATGHASTLYGRTRKIPELFADNFNTRQFGERAAMNMPVQGTASDIMKIAMVRVYNALRAKNLKSRILLQVHDELLIEAPISEAEEVKRLLKQEMESAAGLSVTLAAEVTEGKNWREAK